MTGQAQKKSPPQSNETADRTQERHREIEQETAIRYKEFAESVRHATEPEMARALHVLSAAR